MLVLVASGAGERTCLPGPLEVIHENRAPGSAERAERGLSDAGEDDWAPDEAPGDSPHG